ncbi:MAG: D-glycero-beta-D-manno-heptose 1-phosphate adenylyltransferase [Spirochaetia bacterium]
MSRGDASSFDTRGSAWSSRTRLRSLPRRPPRLIQSARALGGALVVGINSDDSARQLKGRTRPAVPQFARAEVVAGVRGVDFCAVFGQSDPRELLRAVRPDILVKGSEYSRAAIVGRRLVEGRGGSVHRVPHASGWSSTGLMRVVRERRR